MEYLHGALVWLWEELVSEASRNPVLILIVLLGLLSRFGTIVPSGWSGVFFFLGRVRRELGPGFHWMLPFVCAIRKVPVRSVTFAPPPQVVTTADGLVYEVQANVVYRIVDPTRSVVQIADLQVGLTALLPMIVQAVMQQQTRDSLLERDILEKEFAVRAEEPLARWGVQVEQAGFASIAPTKKTLRLTLLARRTAEREQVLERFLAAGLAPETALRLLGAERKLRQIPPGQPVFNIRFERVFRVLGHSSHAEQ